MVQSNDSTDMTRPRNRIGGVSEDRDAGGKAGQETEDANRQLIEYADALNRVIAEIKVKNERLSALALELSSVEERERGKIAEDLHDHIGQTLAMARVKLQELRKSAGISASARLDEIEDLISQAISYSRSMMFEISPNALLELGFIDAVEWLVEYIHGKYDLDIRYSLCSRTFDMDDNIRMILFKAVRELLINVAKHAGTGMADISVENIDGGLRITVEDYGCGFDHSMTPLSAQDKIKFGLFNMQQRIKNAGGRIDIDSSSSHGTRVSITMPQQTGPAVRRRQL